MVLVGLKIEVSVDVSVEKTDGSVDLTVEAAVKLVVVIGDVCDAVVLVGIIVMGDCFFMVVIFCSRLLSLS